MTLSDSKKATQCPVVAIKEYHLNLNFNTGPLSVGEVMKRARKKKKSKVKEAIYVIVLYLGV